MGVYHFTPVGLSPGAVTAALAYIKQNPKVFTTRGSAIDSLVIFTSPEIRRGEERLSDDCIYNRYNGKEIIKEWKKNSASILEVIIHFIKQEIAPILPDKGKVYVCPLNPDDYDNCFETVTKASLYFSSPGHTGKHIWANLTGGTNVMNAALLQVSFLSGLIGRLYYTFVPYAEDRKYLQSRDIERHRFKWDDIPRVKTNIDDIYHLLLKMLSQMSEGWYLDEELLSRFKQLAYQHLSTESADRVNQMDIQIFRQEYLNKMDGVELQRQVLPDQSQGREIRLSESGKQLVKWFNSDLFKALVQRGKGEEVETAALLGDFKPEELWSK